MKSLLSKALEQRRAEAALTVGIQEEHTHPLYIDKLEGHILAQAHTIAELEAKIAKLRQDWNGLAVAISDTVIDPTQLVELVTHYREDSGNDAVSLSE